MPRKKHKKISEVRSFSNVFDYKDDNVELAIRNYFGNDKPLTLELGCGQADYTVSLACLHPEENFIGIDRKPNRIWNASKNATELQLSNAAFLIAYIEKLDQIFTRKNVARIWITFPDPYPRRSSMKKRLTHPRFLEIYKKIMLDGGVINLKTDDDTLYHYTLDVVKELNLPLIKCSEDLYSSTDLNEEEKILTKYEKQHLTDGKKIKLVSFRPDFWR